MMTILGREDRRLQILDEDMRRGADPGRADDHRAAAIT
jgi:hypothetical protein